MDVFAPLIEAIALLFIVLAVAVGSVVALAIVCLVVLGIVAWRD